MFSLMRLLRRKKVWKLLTNKLPIKLYKLNRSKPIKKPKNKSYKTSKKLGWPSSLSIQPKRFKNKKPNPHTLIHHQSYRRPPPVFVDQLFIEPVLDVHPLVAAVEQEEGKKDKSRPSSSLDHTIGRPESSHEDGSVVDDRSMVSADDMWESMVLASPQMDGINERAEEFIARFRADMHHQEMQLARRL
ncbi:hypothetical protein BUALT_Bualt13G0022000 [Buddleja alternifolia]|uniref:Uncharacterized protein n=1 Tax=Buddleja alternifolia TaxID=168488 RepID=A0AAV6WSJ1_9LAMI|nr:hypothetical protein BUALT_Bualt13G0020000 [Buddleja alternifolia]KAG8370808.1 hypothetical protein BUALT_Bualt13G0022000 [Buddleja alternifolia]